VAHYPSEAEPQPPEEEPPATGTPGPRPKRWPRRLLIGLNIFVAVCLLAAGAGFAYLKYRFGQIHHVSIGSLTPRDSGGSPLNVLMVGSDSRANITSAADQRAFGNEASVGGQRSDTIMLLHVDPKQKKAAILSIPRDLWVPIAGKGYSERINTAYDSGPNLLVQTIQQDLGIQINHYIAVDFVGFRGIVNTVGGVNVYFPAPARDSYSGLNITQAGCLKLSGDQALQYVRARHYEYYEAGRWHEDPTADLGRIQRQQDFMRRILRKAISSGLANPLRLNALISNGVNYVTIDKGLSPGTLLSLGSRFHSLSPDTVDMMTLPTKIGSERVGSSIASVLFLQQPDASQVLARFNGNLNPATVESGSPKPGVPTDVVPNQVTVRVLNGNGVGGEAGKVASALSGVGYNVAGVGDAESFRYQRSVITYGPNQQDKAQLLQVSLPGGAEIKEDISLRGVDVVLTVGSDYAGVQNPTSSAGAGTANASSGGAATTTSSTPATTTTMPNLHNGLTSAGQAAAASC
jgi:LCP family protein required for cell wall assembly